MDVRHLEGKRNFGSCCLGDSRIFSDVGLESKICGLGLRPRLCC